VVVNVVVGLMGVVVKVVLEEEEKEEEEEVVVLIRAILMVMMMIMCTMNTDISKHVLRSVHLLVSMTGFYTAGRTYQLYRYYVTISTIQALRNDINYTDTT
jgi:uncharacterized membrane protein